MYVCRSRSIAFDLPAFGNKVAPRKDSLICFNNPQTPCEKVIDIPLRISQKKIIVISSWNLVLFVPKRIQLRYSSYSTAIFRANRRNVNYNVLQMTVFRNPSPIILMLHATQSYIFFLIFWRINQSHLEFAEMLAILSAIEVGNALKVLIHTNTHLEGEYWDMLRFDKRWVVILRCWFDSVQLRTALSQLLSTSWLIYRQ